MSVTDELLAASEAHAADFTEGDLPKYPARQVAIVGCMDCRITITQVFGLNNGDAHIIRNAGGIVNEETLRSLVISTRLLGTKEILIVNHTDCGMMTFTDEGLRDVLRKELGRPLDTIPFYTFTDLEDNVRWQVQKVRDSPLVADSISVRGFIYDVHMGKVTEVLVP